MTQQQSISRLEMRKRQAHGEPTHDALSDNILRDIPERDKITEN